MTTLPDPTLPCVTAPIIDCEPPLWGTPLTAARLRRRTHRRPVVGTVPVRVETAAPEAARFAETALRRVLEVLDRRRPAAALHGLLAPALIDPTIELAGRPQPGGPAVLRRVRLRGVNPQAAEVYATFTRGQRVRVMAARVQRAGERWQVVALQIG